MKKKAGYIKVVYIFMLLTALPLLWWTMEVTTVPHNIVPNEVGAAVVPQVREGMEYVQLGGWLGAGLYLVAALAGGLGLTRLWPTFTFGEVLLQFLLLLASLGSAFFLGELYWLTLFPLTLLSGVLVSSALWNMGSYKNR